MVIDDLLSNEAVLAELGMRIKDARIAFPLTQYELAQRAGVAPKLWQTLNGVPMSPWAAW